MNFPQVIDLVDDDADNIIVIQSNLSLNPAASLAPQYRKRRLDSLSGRKRSTIQGQARTEKYSADDVYEIAPYLNLSQDKVDRSQPGQLHMPAQRRRRLSNGKDEIALVAQPNLITPPEDLVLEFFPDAALEYVRSLLRQHHGNHEQAILHLAEHPNYPKSKNDIELASRSILHQVALCDPAVIYRERDSLKRTWTYDFASVSSFQPTSIYQIEASALMYNTFSWLSKKGSTLLIKKHSHYSIAFSKVVTVMKGSQGDEVDQLNRYNSLTCAVKLDPTFEMELQPLFSGLLPVNQLFVRRSRVRKHPVSKVISDNILAEEIQYTEHLQATWMNRAKRLQERRLNQSKALRLGTGMECSCCYDKFDLDDMVCCQNEGHLFCVGCLHEYAKNQVFGEGNLGVNRKTKAPLLDLSCFHPDGCDSPFDRSILKKALTIETLKKYDEIQANLVISKAGLDSELVECPQCGYQAFLPEKEKEFECPVNDCRFKSCRFCGKKAHRPLRCEEVEADAIKTSGRITVEEAVSKAKIRTCPKCKKGVIKESGCNKIRCSCGVFFCYVCTQLLDQARPYTHFCSIPHCDHKSCNKCVLHTNTEKEDEVAMEKARLQAELEVKAKMGLS